MHKSYNFRVYIAILTTIQTPPSHVSIGRVIEPEMSKASWDNHVIYDVTSPDVVGFLSVNRLRISVVPRSKPTRLMVVYIRRGSREVTPPSKQNSVCTHRNMFRENQTRRDFAPSSFHISINSTEQCSLLPLVQRIATPGEQAITIAYLAK